MNNDERNQFAEMYYARRIPDFLPNDELEKRYTPIIEFLKKYFPQKLYRFRRCEERHFDAFYNNQIWASNGECMNDGFDGRLFFDKSSIENEIRDSLSDAALKEMIVSFKSSNSPFGAVFSQLDDESLYTQLKAYRDGISSTAMSRLSDLVSVVQRTTKFACLSEDICSSAMWGHYSYNESGFALEYYFSQSDWNKTENGIQETFSLYPTIYSDNRFKVSDEYIQFLIKRSLLSDYPDQSLVGKMFPCPDTSMVTKISLQKSAEWSYEKEWRIIYTKNDKDFQTNKSVCFFEEPTAIYLGRRISYLHERLLKDIANEKKIRVYKMYLDDESPTYRLIPKQIQ